MNEIKKIIESDLILQAYINLFAENYIKDNYDEYTRLADLIESRMSKYNIDLVNYDFKEYLNLKNFI